MSTFGSSSDLSPISKIPKKSDPGGSGPADIPSRRGEDLNLKLLCSILRYTEENYGKDAATRILDRIGLSLNDLSGPRYWISHAQFEKVLSSCRALFENDEEFKIACRYRLAESFGPLRYLVRAASVGATFVHAVRTMHLVSHISHYELLSIQPGNIITKYSSDRPESRLMCLSRISNIEAFATLWGLPLAVVKESGCIADGDDACTYHIKWYERPRWLPALFGALLGGAGSAALVATGGSTAAACMLPVLGALLLHIRELGKVYRRNVEFSEENNKHLRDLAKKNAQALQEVSALTQRHKDWSQLLEAQISENQRRMEDALEHMGALMTERHSRAARTSHDMGSPLQILGMLRFSLEPHIRPDDREGLEVLDDAVEAAERISKLARKLMDAPVRPLGVALPIKPELLEVAPLAERFKRRTMAQVIGKDIRVSSFTSRDAPASIHIDHLLFDRVVDNLLTNAARYTEKGSILIEVDGTAGSLVVKVSDTGAGIAEKDLRMVFQPGKTGKVKHENSRGLGLPIVVDLLDQVGGRLEVLSRPGVGTTFWAHFPIEAKTVKQSRYKRDNETVEEVIGRVVTFRARPAQEKDDDSDGKIAQFPRIKKPGES